MIRRLLLRGVALLLVVFPCFGCAGEARLQSFQLTPSGQGARLTLTFDQSVPVKVFHLVHPDRIVLDIPQARLATVLPGALPLQGVRKIRSGQPQPGVRRLVLDVAPGMRWQQRGAGTHRLVMDLFLPSSVVSRVPPVAPGLSTRPFMVVIDPGHGGHDPGARGPGKTREKDVVLAIARLLAQKINEMPGMRAVLTRSGDFFVPLRKRLQLARHGKGDLFVSVHADSWFDHKAEGASAYALSRHGATSEAARWLAGRENDSELAGVHFNQLADQSRVLRSVLIDLAQTATIRDSLHLGREILAALQPVTGLHYHHVEQAPFMVLKSPDIPSVLVETGFLSNAAEEQRLRQPVVQEKMANAIFRGITEYVKKYVQVGAAGDVYREKKKV